MDYTGNNINQVDNIAEPSTCQTLCQVTVGCKFYAFYKSLKRCFLKDNVARKVPNSDVIIGPRTCPGDFHMYHKKFQNATLTILLYTTD